MQKIFAHEPTEIEGPQKAPFVAETETPPDLIDKKNPPGGGVENSQKNIFSDPIGPEKKFKYPLCPNCHTKWGDFG